MPNSNVILDLSNNNDKGLQLSLNSSISNLPGLLYFDNSKNLIAYSNSSSVLNYVSFGIIILLILILVLWEKLVLELQHQVFNYQYLMEEMLYKSKHWFFISW